MADIDWGSPSSWADVAAAASWNALANGSSIVSAAIDNTTALAEYAEVSFVCVTSTMAVGAGGHLAVYILPLLHDGTSYPTGDTSGTTVPGANNLRGIIASPAGTISPRGSVIVSIPWSTFKIAVVNRFGAALPASATNITCRYRTGSEAVT